MVCVADRTLPLTSPARLDGAAAETLCGEDGCWWNVSALPFRPATYVTVQYTYRPQTAVRVSVLPCVYCLSACRCLVPRLASPRLARPPDG
jgi:hypothetical protein